MSKQPDLWIFFAAPSHGLSFRHAAARGLARRYALQRLIQVLGRSVYTHCAVGHRGVVLEPAADGDQWWPMLSYIDRYPGLVHYVRVVAATDPDLQSSFDPRPKPWLPSIARLLTRGRVTTRDCVATALIALRRAGHPAPRSIVTPRQLVEWLAEQGHTIHAFR